MAVRVLCAFEAEEVFDFVKNAVQSVVPECEVIKASSEALALFLTQKNFPCLIVCEMQDEESWTVNLLNELKAEPTLARIPLVFLAKRPDSVCIQEPLLPGGAEFVLCYPIETYEFLKAIRTYLKEIKDERVPETPE